jgi:hypothetical protein
MGDLGLDGKIILKPDLVTSGGLLWIRQWAFGFHNI